MCRPGHKYLDALSLCKSLSDIVAGPRCVQAGIDDVQGCCRLFLKRVGLFSK